MSACVTELRTRVFRVPTDRPEADGTIAWDSTTLALVEAQADSGECGLGFSYTAAGGGSGVSNVLPPTVVGRDGARATDVAAHGCGRAKHRQTGCCRQRDFGGGHCAVGRARQG